METITDSTYITDIKEYDWLKDLPEHCFSIILDGSRASGKSFCLNRICYLIKNKFDFNVAILISGTAGLQTDTFNYIHEDHKYEADHMEQVLSKLIKIQKDELKKHDGNKD